MKLLNRNPTSRHGHQKWRACVGLILILLLGLLRAVEAVRSSGFSRFDLLDLDKFDDAPGQHQKRGVRSGNRQLQSRSITLILEEQIALTTVNALLDLTRIKGLIEEGEFTAFLPSDFAFRSPPGNLGSKLVTSEYGAHLTNLLLHHLSVESIPQPDLRSEQPDETMSVATLDGGTVNFSVSRRAVRIDGERVLAYAEASNGHVYLTRNILDPGWFGVTVASILQQVAPAFYELAVQFGLEGLLTDMNGSVTVFAPSDAIIDLFLRQQSTTQDAVIGLIRYHISTAVRPVDVITPGRSTIASLDGDTIFLENLDQTPSANGVSLSVEELAINGVVHRINDILSDQFTPAPLPTLVGEIAGNPSFRTLLSALDLAGLTSMLDTDPGPLTVLAPTDTAFAVLQEAFTELYDAYFTFDWRVHLREVLEFHITAEALPTSSLFDGQAITMVNGEEVTVSELGILFTFDPSLVGTALLVRQEADTVTTNGFLQGISNVLTPSFLSVTTDQLLSATASVFYAAVVAVNLESYLQTRLGATVFAPSNAALDGNPLFQNPVASAELEALVRYHIVEFAVPSINLPDGVSELVTLEGQSIVVGRSGPLLVIILPTGTVSFSTLDGLASNGVVHVIDQVLTVPPRPPSIDAAASVAGELSRDFSATLLNNFVDTAGLTVLLESPRFTDQAFEFFAPNNQAFAILASNDNPVLFSKISTDQYREHLRNLLLFHTVLEPLPAFVGQRTTTMANGEDRVITGNGVRLEFILHPDPQTQEQIDNIALVLNSVPTLNGVYYPIDEVLLPSFVFSTLSDLISERGYSIFSRLLQATPFQVLFGDEIQSFTIIAVTNSAPAFDLTGSFFQELTMDLTRVGQVLGYHVIPSVEPSINIPLGTSKTVETLQGGQIVLHHSITGLRINGVEVRTQDILGINGIIHEIDELLLPPGF